MYSSVAVTLVLGLSLKGHCIVPSEEVAKEKNAIDEMTVVAIELEASSYVVRPDQSGIENERIHVEPPVTGIDERSIEAWKNGSDEG